MARPGATQPTDVELLILRVLWARGPSTVRQVHRALEGKRKVGYSTTLKMLQVMNEKGLVERDDAERPQQYTAARPQNQTQLAMLNNLVDKAFDGSMQKLLLRAVEGGRVTTEELAEIRKLIRQVEAR